MDSFKVTTAETGLFMCSKLKGQIRQTAARILNSSTQKASAGLGENSQAKSLIDKALSN